MTLNYKKYISWFLMFGLFFALFGCNGGGGSGDSDTFSIDSNVEGLISGQSLTLNIVAGNNTPESQLVSSNGEITIAKGIVSGTNYSITIPVQPQSERCAVNNPNGQIVDSDVVVNITCSDSLYTIGGTISGLEPGENVSITNYNQITNNLTLTNDTTATFNNKTFTLNDTVPYLGAYNIQISNQPQNQICTVNNTQGVAHGNVSDISITCSKTSYPVLVNYIGTEPKEQNIVLFNNGNTQDPVAINALHTTGAFKQQVAYGTPYNVTLQNPLPKGYRCHFINSNTGNPVNANTKPVVEVSCSKQTTGYTIGGMVSGLAVNEGVTIQTNSIFTNPYQTIESNGVFTYPNTFNLGESYNVTIYKQPKTQYCLVTNGSGVINGNVTNINISCSYEKGQLIPLRGCSRKP